MLCLSFSARMLQVFLRDCLRVLKLKISFIIFLFTFQNFEVVVNSNMVKYNCQPRMRRMTMNEK